MKKNDTEDEENSPEETPMTAVDDVEQSPQHGDLSGGNTGNTQELPTYSSLYPESSQATDSDQFQTIKPY